MTEIEQILNSKKMLYWDKSILNPEKDKFIILERILELGTERDVQVAISSYGQEFAKHVVMESRNLSPKTVNYFSFIFDFPREEARCFSDASPKIWRPY
jgi:hypothetical protein